MKAHVFLDGQVREISLEAESLEEWRRLVAEGKIGVDMIVNVDGRPVRAGDVVTSTPSASLTASPPVFSPWNPLPSVYRSPYPMPFGGISPFYVQNIRKRHSVMGIFSFILALFDVLVMIGIVGLFLVIDKTQPGGLDELDEKSPLMILAGLAIMLWCGTACLVAVLASIDLFSSYYQRTYNLIALTISGMMLLLIGLMMIVGTVID